MDVSGIAVGHYFILCQSQWSVYPFRDHKSAIHSFY